MLKRSKHTTGEDEQNPSSEDVGIEAEHSAGANSGDEGEISKLRAQVAEKDVEIAELKDKYLRALADSENTRKRFRQQADETIRLQRENLLRDLLPMIDNLERAVEAARSGGKDKTIVEGVEMVLRSMFDFLKGHGVSQLQAVGQRFDPALHEAVDHVKSSEHPPNTVIEEFHRGYQIGDKTLRAARVSVAKGKGNADGNGAPGKSGGNEVENS